jgi:hypothetical protein
VVAEAGKPIRDSRADPPDALAPSGPKARRDEQGLRSLRPAHSGCPGLAQTGPVCSACRSLTRGELVWLCSCGREASCRTASTRRTRSRSRLLRHATWRSRSSTMCCQHGTDRKAGARWRRRLIAQTSAPVPSAVRPARRDGTTAHEVAYYAATKWMHLIDGEYRDSGAAGAKILQGDCS